MVEFKTHYLGCDHKGNSYRLYFADDLWLVIEQRNDHGTFLTGFLELDEAIDFLDQMGCDIEELRPSMSFAEQSAWAGY